VKNKTNPLINKNIRIVLLVLILLDLGYSFYQHYHMSLGGDLGDNIAATPERGFYHVLKDPLGLSVLFEDKVYSNPNKFFAHWTVLKYFRTAPLFLQRFVEPVESIYLASSIAKILIQILILYLLSVYISNTRNPLKLDFLMSAVLISPLFQTWGYNRYMGIVDQSVVYAFFYALPVGLLLLFFMSFFRSIYYRADIKFTIILQVLLALFIPVLTLNGPLIPGIVLVACPLVLLSQFIKNWRSDESGTIIKATIQSIKKIPGPLLYFSTGIILFSLYSLHIGRNNALTINDSIPYIERYLKLPQGLYYLLTSKLGFPLLFLVIIANLIIIVRQYRSAESDGLIKLLKWLGIFALLYILLLPLGGYRSYRPNILRYDTFIPVTLSIMFAFGTTSLYLIKRLKGRRKSIYLAALVSIILMFANADRVNKADYLCERQALEMIAISTDSIVALEADCKIMDWRITTDPVQRELDADLLLFWNVTNEKRLFFQKE